ncbi:MAG: ABC transporter ATP-binding protein [Ilumatobacteraceae bacterium]
MGALLTLDAVVAGYGQGLVLKGVDLTVDAGEVTCLIGPNGAGKSTVLKTVSGLLRPRSGTVCFDSEDISNLSTHERLLRGIVHVPQDRSLFPAMTVWDNVLMGAYIVRDNAAVRARLATVVEMFPIVERRRQAHAGSLSGGEQKIVEIARTLMLDPKLILLDEPSIGLDPKSRRLVFDTIRELTNAGRTVLLVEQNARSGLAVAHHGAILEAGVVKLEGTGLGLLDDPMVAQLYLGAAAPPTIVASDVSNVPTSPNSLSALKEPR